MATKIVISFEYDAVKVVYASERGGNFLIHKTLSFTDDEFDSFLQREKATEFLVVYDFKTFYSDIIHLPPVKRRYFKDIVESKTRKKFPELKEFSSIYTILGEGLHEGKTRAEVFVFAVNNDEIEAVTDRFTRYGKRITHLIPSLFSLARTVQPAEGPVLCVTKSGINKNLFLLKDGKIIFIRVAQGIDSGFHDSDVKNINMTINYCRQSLKTNPSRVILIGNACFEHDAEMGPIVPLICIDYRPQVLASKKTIIEFISAIACIRTGSQSKTFLRASNILPGKYKSLHTIKTAISYSTILFLILLVSGLGYMTFEILRLTAVQERIELIRSEMENRESVSAEYLNKEAELRSFIPLLNITNRMNSKPDVQKALLVLPELYLKNIQINNISVIPGAEAIKLSVKGAVEAERFSEMQVNYQNLVDSLEKIDDMEISFDRIETKNKTFVIEAQYND